MTPEQFAMVEVFPLLGIKPSDCLWYKNLVGVSYAFHGLLMNTNAMAKLGQLYLQGGLAKENERVVSQDWVDESTSEVEPGSDYGYLWWVLNSNVYFAGGMGD
jgi:CubicO group peptidase (beta-lactamase class C family)